MDQQIILETIVRHTREIMPGLGERPLQGSDSLRALGANSVDRSEIIMMTLESLSLDIPLVVLARAENMGDLAEIMGRRSAGA